MSKESIVHLLMTLNVNTSANVILERSLRANEGHIGVKERILTIEVGTHDRTGPCNKS